MDKSTKRLHALMKKNQLSCGQVGELLGRSTMTVRIWRTGSRIIPSHSLELLEYKLAAKAKK